MHILIFYPAILHKGGSERVVLETAKKFNAPIFTSAYKPESTFEEFGELDIQVIRSPLFETTYSFLGKESMFYVPAVAGSKFLSYKVREDYDVINAHGTPANWIRNRNPGVCWYFYAPIRSGFDLYDRKVRTLPLHKKVIFDSMLSMYTSVEKFVDYKIEKIISTSPYVNVRDKGFIKEFFKEDPEVIPVGVHPEEFVNEAYDKYFFYPSRFVPEKRFEYAIEAFRIFSKTNKGWRLIFAGHLSQRSEHQKYFEHLKSIAEGLAVEFKTGLPAETLRSLYANAYAVLFCAIKEDWGLIPLEAMASEKPCISVNEGGPSYSIIDGTTGFLVDSPSQMAEKMSLLASDPTLNENIGRNGRRRILDNYTYEIFFHKLERAFKGVAARRSQ